MLADSVISQGFQGLLSALGLVLARLYDIVHNYGIAIVLLTLLIRILLMPLTIKQVRSMTEMQAIQPLIKEIQKKYKGDRQKMNEELMKVYKEHKVNPLGGCLPLLMQFPFFIALYAVLRGDPKKAALRFKGRATSILPAVAHLPASSALAAAILANKANFLGMNLACSPTTLGHGLIAAAKGGAKIIPCGNSASIAIPAFVLVALMVFTTWYQQRQMQQMSGQATPQMQMMGRIMPVFLGFISLNIPTGVLLYWVTTNVWQVGQQRFMMRQREAQGLRQAASGNSKPKSDGAGKPKPGSKPVVAPERRPNPAGRGGSGRSGGGSRKKRRKR